jgi:hypothetical protein
LEKNWMLRTIFRKKIGCSARFFQLHWKKIEMLFHQYHI